MYIGNQIDGGSGAKFHFSFHLKLMLKFLWSAWYEQSVEWKSKCKCHFFVTCFLLRACSSTLYTCLVGEERATFQKELKHLTQIHIVVAQNGVLESSRLNLDVVSPTHTQRAQTHLFQVFSLSHMVLFALAQSAEIKVLTQPLLCLHLKWIWCQRGNISWKKKLIFLTDCFYLYYYTDKGKIGFDLLFKDAHNSSYLCKKSTVLF